jgi:hypothetical protein
VRAAVAVIAVGFGDFSSNVTRTDVSGMVKGPVRAYPKSPYSAPSTGG